MFNIVLHEPQIPQNTGNIVRLCACTNSNLFLVGKPGFLITDKHLKRAGLDYWHDIKIEQAETFEELFNKFPRSNFYFLSTKAKNNYSKVNFKPGDFIVFGSETRGLPENIIFDNFGNALKIPMYSDKRSLNLANSVSIVLYEALRQNQFNFNCPS